MVQSSHAAPADGAPLPCPVCEELTCSQKICKEIYKWMVREGKDKYPQDAIAMINGYVSWLTKTKNNNNKNKNVRRILKDSAIRPS